MDKILGFVPAVLGVVGKGLDAAQDGVEALTGMSKEAPKQSGIYALILGWLGIDPGALNMVGNILMKVAGFLKGF